METSWCSICHCWRATPGHCQQIACLACGTVQCHSNGSARGCCKVCYFGRLPGWSFMGHPRVCTVKGCTAEPVYAYLPGSKKDCCKAHGDAILGRLRTRREATQAKYARRY